jgi:hypothetical protein
MMIIASVAVLTYVEPNSYQFRELESQIDGKGDLRKCYTELKSLFYVCFGKIKQLKDIIAGLPVAVA